MYPNSPEQYGLYVAAVTIVLFWFAKRFLTPIERKAILFLMLAVALITGLAAIVRGFDYRIGCNRPCAWSELQA